MVIAVMKSASPVPCQPWRRRPGAQALRFASIGQGSWKHPRRKWL